MQLKQRMKSVVPKALYRTARGLQQRLRRSYSPPLRGLRPLSDIWGLDRGTPIEVNYIREFLGLHRSDIRGRVLEVGDSRYTGEFGRNVTRSDVLNLEEGNREATIVGDLVNGRGIPSDAFDCMLVINTFLQIYDVRSALRTCYRSLKPGGVLLANFTGIARRAEDPGWGPPGWHGAGDFWRYTSVSARRLCEEAFPADHIAITVRGNVHAAAASLYGKAAEELTAEELAYQDPRFELAIFARAHRPL